MPENEIISLAQPPKESSQGQELSRERNRLIVHLARVFARRYDMQVRPSGRRGVWSCALDTKVIPEIQRFVTGERDSLEDLPPELFRPGRILYDEEGAAEMTMAEITTLLRHEAGHAKFTDFRSMYEGQRTARDQGCLPTSFWLMWEGLEDPRINILEGEESPAIDRQIRLNQGKALAERLQETPILQRPLLLQFAYNSCHYWLNGEFIPELAGTAVGGVCETVRPLLDQFFQNTDVEQRRIIQNQIWEIVKSLEKKQIEQEEMRQVAKEKGLGQAGGSGGEGEKSEIGKGESTDGSGGEPIPAGSSGDKKEKQPGDSDGQAGQTQASSGRAEEEGEKQAGGLEGQEKEQPGGSGTQTGQAQVGSEEETVRDEGEPAGSQSEGEKEGREKKKGLPEFSKEQIQEIEKAIDEMSPEQRRSLAKKARGLVDEAQKKALEKQLQKVLKIEKNKETGEYEVQPQACDSKEEKEVESNFQQALQQVEAEEKAEQDRLEEERRQREELLRRQEALRRQKEEMKKAGFEEDETEMFLLYQSLENAMIGVVRRFISIMEKNVPRRGEPTYEGDYFSGPRFDRRKLIRKAPLGDERFHLRQTEAPTGEPKLFVGLLVDNSGTMKGEKIEQARKTMIFFAKICREMGIPFMMATFGSEAKPIKTFRQDFDNPAERVKPELINSTDGRGGSTDLQAGLDLTIEEMIKERRKAPDSHGLVFVISDGEANSGLVGEDLRQYIRDHKGRLTFKAFGLSGNSSERQSIKGFLDLYFGEGNCAYPESFEDLPEEAFRILRVNFRLFQRLIS